MKVDLSHDDLVLTLIRLNSQPKEKKKFWELEIDFISGMMVQKLHSL